jgi:hypothetical protein
MSYDLYRTSSIYESSANAVSLNPSLAEPGFYSGRPALIHGIPEKPFPKVTDELYSPARKTESELEPERPLGNTEDRERTHPGLAARVAELIELEKKQNQVIEKVIIPADVAEQIGTSAVKLLEAANSL